jgi:periplasmic protein TonB
MRARAVEIVSTLDGADVRRPVDNVVAFVRPDTASVSGHAPSLGGVAPDARPVPVPSVQAKWPLFFAASLALHAGVFAAFYRQAPPLASVGEKAISVEIVLGTHAAAGLAKTPTQSEASVNSAPAQGEGPDLVKPETARSIKVAEVATPVEAEPAPATLAPEQVTPTPVQQQTTVAEAKPVEREAAQDSAAAAKTETKTETPTVSAAVPVLASTAPSAEVAAPVTPIETRVAETPPEVVRAVTPPPRKRSTVTPPRKRRTAARPSRKDKGQDSRTRQSRASAASTASSGIGRGRSDDVSNYRGIVAARLARNKHFPPDARRAGHEGRAVVSFTINGGGSVTRVALVRGTGIASLDREAQAMVNRSSPFPPPPSQRSMRFTVPVSFDIR